MEKNSKLNSILITIVMLMVSGFGIVGWQALQKGNETAEKVSAIVATLPSMNLEITEIKVKQQQTDLRITALELQVMELKTKMKP